MRTPSALGARVKAFRTADGADDRTLGWLQIRVLIVFLLLLPSWDYALRPPESVTSSRLRGWTELFGIGPVFMFLAVLCTIFFLLGVFYLCQAYGLVPVLVTIRTGKGLYAGSVGMLLTGRGKRLGTEAKIRLGAEDAFRPTRGFGPANQVWTIATGGFQVSVNTPLQLNDEVDGQLREFLEQSRDGQRAYALSRPSSSRFVRGL